MKKNKKIYLIILIAITIIVLIVFFATRGKKENNVIQNTENESTEEFVQIQEDGSKINISPKLKENKTIEGLEITNIKLTEQNGQTVLVADVTNLTQSDKGVIGINIVILDKSGKEIGKIPGVITSLQVGETKQLNIGITEDYSNAYDFRVEKQ